ncbi:hypothetical protein JYQ62_10105 [Nostoc sp. UHCC 0702]|nr:hypothetical protein JYQ62_10105 [Nostoc sp. UHCC 0702]
MGVNSRFCKDVVIWQDLDQNSVIEFQDLQSCVGTALAWIVFDTLQVTVNY